MKALKEKTKPNNMSAKYRTQKSNLFHNKPLNKIQ